MDARTAHRHRENGKKYGYSKCCIDQFITSDWKNETSNESYSYSSETGFIMCDGCLDKSIEMYNNIKDKYSFYEFCKLNLKTKGVVLDA